MSMVKTRAKMTVNTNNTDVKLSTFDLLFGKI